MKKSFRYLAGVSICSAALALALALAASAAAGVTSGAASGNRTGIPAHASQVDPEAEGPSRSSYIRTLEPLCKKDTARNVRILKGVRRKVTRGKLAPAARQFSRATRAFTKTLKTVLRTPQPAEDRATLRRWTRFLKKQRTYLKQITTALKRGQGFKAQTLSVRLFSNADRANNTVVGFGFKHCLIEPRKFM